MFGDLFQRNKTGRAGAQDREKSNLQNPDDVASDVNALLDRLKQGAPQERNEIVSLLEQQARNTGTPESWNFFALGLQSVGRLEDSQQILEQLVVAEPSQDIYRLNLATNYSQQMQFERSAYHLQYLTEHASTEQMRQLASQQLRGMDEFIRGSEADKELHELQLLSFRERFAAHTAEPEDYLTFARMRLKSQIHDIEPDALNETTMALEDGHKRFPDNIQVLEMLVYCYLRSGPEDRLQESLRELEQRDPDSRVLKTLANISAEQAAEFAQVQARRAHDLLGAVQSGDAGERQAALMGLARMVAEAPNNPEYRCSYAWALLLNTDYDHALEQAKLAEPLAGTSHTAHFNLGEIFWACGDPVRGRRHLDEAMLYAQTEQERRDVDEILARFSAT